MLLRVPCFLVSGHETRLTHFFVSDSLPSADLLIVSLVFAALAPVAMVGIVVISSLRPFVYYTADAARGIVYGLPLFLSSLSDVTPAKWKTGSFGAVTAVYALGYAFAPLFAVALEYRTVCVTSLIFIFLALLFAVCYLPETLPDTSRNQAIHSLEEDEAVTPSCHRIAAALYRPIDELCIVRRSQLFILLSFLSIFAGMNLSADSTFTIYYIENQMHFNDKDVSVFFLVLGAVSLFTQGILLAPLTARIGEKMAMIVGFSLSALHSFLYGFARDKATIFMAAAAAGVAGMALPTIGSVMANNVDSSEQGRIQGALYSLSSLAQGLGPIFLQSIYICVKDTHYPGPGGMFIAAGLLQIISIIISCLLPRDKTDYAKRAAQIQTEPNHMLTQALIEDDDGGDISRIGQVV
jgi:DHA1 family tetracycline resistance protein-like MFS transporter